jgi:hypothetical protein
LVWVVGLAAVLSAGAAAPAAASITTGSMKIRTKDFTVAAGAAGGGTVPCPTGYKATAGGASWTAVDQTRPAVVLLRWLSASVPTKNDTAWFVAGYNDDSTEATLHVRVTCLPKSVVGTTTKVDRWLDFLGDTVARKATVGCGAGKVVVGGGAAWQVQGSPLDVNLAQDHMLASSSPAKTGKGWFGAGVSNAAGVAMLRVTAFCRPSSSVGAYTIRFKEINPVGVPIAFVAFFADGGKTCPSGRLVTGGAYWQNPFDGGKKTPVADGTLGQSFGTGKTGWSATASPGATTDRQLVVVVLCRP